MSYTPGFYGRLARFVLDHQLMVALVVVTVTVAGAVLGLPPKVDSDLVKLLPQDSLSGQALLKLNTEEGGVNLLNVSYKLADGTVDKARLDPVLDEVVAGFSALPEVEHAFHSIDPDLAFQIGLYQLSPAEVRELTLRLKGALALGPALNPIVTQRIMAMGPLTDKIGKSQSISGLSSKEGLGRVIIRPRGSSNNPDFAIPFMDKAEVVLAEVEARHPEVKRVWLGGAYRHTVEDVRGIRYDLTWTTLVSTVLVLALIAISLRSIKSTVMLFVPLTCANLVTLGLVGQVLGHLNTYTSFGTAVLIGLGIEFSIHLTARYREERLAGAGTEEAIVKAWDIVGGTNLSAALTGAGGFLALCIASFKGFVQLGLLLASGLMLCLVFSLVTLPILILWLDPNPKTLIGTRMKRFEPKKNTRYPFAVPIAIGLLGATALATFFLVPKIDWEYDLGAMRRHGLAYSELSEEERTLAKESYSPLIVFYEDNKTLRADQARIDDLIKTGKTEFFARTLSIATFLPEDQEVRLEAIRELQAIVSHPNFRYLPPPIVKNLLPLKDRKLEVLPDSALPRALVGILTGKNSDQSRMLIIPQGNLWDLRETKRMADEVAKVFPDRMVAGEQLSVSAMFTMIKTDVVRCTLLALIAVLGITIIELRKPLLGAMATISLTSALLCAASLMPVFGMKLSLINVAALPMLLGIGVDVIIHLLHRMEEEGPGGIRNSLLTTGLAAFLGTATSILSFISLTLASMRGVQGLGWVVTLGLCAVFFVGVTLLPALWASAWRLGRKLPELAKELASEIAEELGPVEPTDVQPKGD